ncbi:MAG TPA: MFS transporter, partial [candidate division Zixibacteria bacterium]|nr:MFS transporter [candidate division Zixibacteria bacterium]
MADFKRLLSYAFLSEGLTRDVLLICLSNVVGALGEGLYFWFFPLYIRSLGADYVQLGLVLSTLMGFAALVPLFGGLLADRFDRKKILILSWTPWVIAPLIYSFASNWVQLIPGTFCWGLSMIGLPAVTAYVITCVSDKTKLASVLAVVWGSYSFSYIFAPGIGGYLAAIMGMQWVLRVSTVLSAVATGVFFFLQSQHPRKEKTTEENESAYAREKRGLRQRMILALHAPEEEGLWRKILIWSVFLAFSSFFIGIGRTFVQTFLNESVKMNEVQIGLFGSINYAGMTFIGIGMGRVSDKWRKSGAIGVCLLLYLVSIIPLLLFRDIPTLMFIAFLLGGSAITAQLVYSFVGTIAPKAKRGLCVSIPQTFSLVASFAGPYLGGYLYTFSPIYAFISSVSIIPILAAYAFVVMKD